MQGSRTGNTIKQKGGGRTANGSGNDSSTTRGAVAGVNPSPPYPEIARRNGWEGLVMLIVKVTSDGRADSVVVAKSSGYDILDKTAYNTVAKWSFHPATLDGIPIDSFIEVPIRFKLK